MTLQLAFLKGINVAGHRPVAMAALRGLVESLGFEEVRSVLQSGNLVFRGDGRKGEGLERLLEREAERRLGLRTEFFVRAATEWKALIAANPFPEEASRDPAHLLVMLLKSAPAGKDVEALRAAVDGPELVQVKGKQAYLVYPNGIGRSRVTGALIERKLGARGTGRNWNTVLKLQALAEE